MPKRVRPRQDLPDTPATVGMLTPYAIWIGVLGKALIRNKVLKREEIVADLESIRDTIPDSGTVSEINLMIETVNRW